MASTDKKNVISSLIESGKAKGKLSTKDITDALEELDYDVEQVDKLYSTSSTACWKARTSRS